MAALGVATAGVHVLHLARRCRGVGAGRGGKLKPPPGRLLKPPSPRQQTRQIGELMKPPPDSNSAIMGGVAAAPQQQQTLQLKTFRVPASREGSRNFEEAKRPHGHLRQGRSRCTRSRGSTRNLLCDPSGNTCTCAGVRCLDLCARAHVNVQIC